MVIRGLYHGLVSLNCICNPPFTNSICVEGGITPLAQLPRERWKGVTNREVHNMSLYVNVISRPPPQPGISYLTGEDTEAERSGRISPGHMTKVKLPVFALPSVYEPTQLFSS